MDKIICLGKTYSNHSIELHEPHPEKPVIFLKPPSILRKVLRNKEKLSLHFPHHRGTVHPECEIVFQIGKQGEKISKETAWEYITGFSIGLDLTLRDQQKQLKENGHPWTIAKVFLDSAVVGPWISSQEFLNQKYISTDFSFQVQQEVKQKSKLQNCVFSPQECVAYVSQFFPLCPGDLIFMGTPEGVSAIASGTEAKLSWGEIEYTVNWI